MSHSIARWFRIPGFCALAVLGWVGLAESAEARTRGFCNVPVIGDIYNHPCGKDNQIACNTGAACDSGRRYIDSPNVTIDCIAFPDETIGGVCTPCGQEGEMGCGGASPCASGLALATTGGLNGSIGACSAQLPADPGNISVNVPSFTVGVCPFCTTYNPPNVNINPPSIVSILNSAGMCSPGAPENLMGASREVWPAVETASVERGTTIFIHGRGSSCGGKDPLLHSGGGMLYERNHRMYCAEYDRSGAQQTVVVYEPLEQSTGEGPVPCAANDSCTFNLADPVYQTTAPSYSVPGVAHALAGALQKIPTEGEITVVAHSQGGFIMRALLHEHYDELRWAGEKISRVVTLGHPYYGKVVDPKKVVPWMCVNNEDFDCRVQEWLWGWESWLGTTPGNIDDTDFPQIEWSAIAGDGLNSAGTGPGGTSPEPQTDSCLELFGGTWRPDVEGDTSVPIQSSIGIDEHGYYPVGTLSFDDVLQTRCAHGSSCQIGASLVADPNRVPTASAPGLPIPGALDFDGVDDAVGGLAIPNLAHLEMTDALSVEAWIRPDASGQTGIIVNKEGEYEVGLIAGELSWAVANSSPGWNWTGSGYSPPLDVWTHVAFVYDAIAGTGTSYVGGYPVHSAAATGLIGDAITGQDDFRIGGREATNQPFAGRIADVRVWASVRTAPEIRAGASRVPDTGDLALRGWWTLDTGGGDAVLDASSYAHDLSLTALGASTAPRRHREDRLREGGALYFDGVDDRIEVTDLGVLSALEMANTLTIEAWLYPRGPGGSSGGVIVNKEGEYALTRLTDGTIAFSLAGTSLGWVTVPTAASAPERTWTHVALSYSGNGPGVEIYENGVLVDSIAATGSIGDFSASQNELWIGGRQATGNNQWFHGLLDEVRLWNVRRGGGSIAKFDDRVLSTWSQAGLVGYWRFDEISGGLATDGSAQAHHAALDASGSATTPLRSYGPALPGYPSGIFLAAPPKPAPRPSCGVGPELALVLPFLAFAHWRRRGNG